MDYYNMNMALLKEYRPDLFSDIEKKKSFIHSNLDAIDSITAKDGNKVIVVQYRSKEYRLNSSYRPIEEAKRWAKAYEIKGINTVINMFGLGNGIFARALMEKMDDTSYLMIYEPSFDIFDHTLRNYDITDIISNERVLLFIEGINSDSFRRVSSSFTNITNLGSQIHCIHPRYDEIYAESAVKFYKDLKDSYITERINTNTIKKLAKGNIDNLFNNMIYLRESSSLDAIKEKIPCDIPAIVVAAGPSVEENIENLKKVKGKAVIFAVDRIINYLLDHDVEPDFVVSIDPYKSVMNFTREDPVTTPLIAYMESNYELLKLHKGKKIFCVNDNFMIEIYRKAGKDIPYIQPSGSVAIVAFSICLYLGFKEIILVGQDLAYKDNKTHAGADDEVQFNPDTDVMLEGINGEKVRSRYDWHEFVKRYEDIINQCPDITVIDAKKHGAKISGTKVMELGQAIDIYCNRQYNFKFADEDIKSIFTDKDITEIKNYLKSNLKILSTIKEKLKYAINDCDILIKENNNSNSKKFKNALKRIEKINKFIQEQAIYSVMDAYIVALTTDEMSKIFDISDNVTENNLNTLKRSKAIYEAATVAVDYVYPKLENAISIL